MGRIRAALVATHACMVARIQSTPARAEASARMRRSPTSPSRGSAVSAAPFSPDHFRRGDTRPVGCYAVFKWWLPLSQHPGCLRGPASLQSTKGAIRGLNRRSGLFPFRRRSLSPAV